MLKLIRMSTIGLSLDIFCRGLLKELSYDYDVTAIASPDEALANLSRREGVKVIGVEMRRNISPFHDLISLIKLIRVFRREQPDILHTMTPKAGLLGMLAARIAGVPVRIHTFTGLLFPTAKGMKRKLLTVTDKLTCACATHIVPEGEGVKNDLLQNRITSKPLKVLGYGNVRGIDTELYQSNASLKAEASAIRKRLGIPTDATVFVFIGRFVGDKGLRELLHAFKNLHSDHCHLLLVGDIEGAADDLQEAEFNNIHRLHLSGGWVNDVRPWLLAGDIFVFPSYREGFPNVVLEAGAMGLPSIVTDINGSREIITDGVNSIVVPPGDANRLADAMRSLADASPERLATLGANARKNIIDKYTQRYVRDCIKEYYRNIINDRTTR